MPKQYDSVQAMLDDIGSPEFAEEFREHEKKLSVRLRKWWFILLYRFRAWVSKEPTQ
ncbi:hypothetical protein [Petrachloros mirabilis]